MAKGFKRYLGKELRQQERETYRRKLAELRHEARRQKQERKRRLKEQKSACDARVREAAQKAQAEFERARELARAAQKAATESRQAARREAKQAARDKCRLEREHVKLEAEAKIQATKAEAEAERAFRQELAAMARGQRKEQRRLETTAAERRSESDDEVRHNLPPELHHAWERRKRYTKATPLRSRTEAFLDWLHDHPDEQLAAQEAKLPTEAEMARSEAAYWASRQGTGARGMVDVEVPF